MYIIVCYLQFFGGNETTLFETRTSSLSNCRHPANIIRKAFKEQTDFFWGTIIMLKRKFCTRGYITSTPQVLCYQIALSFSNRIGTLFLSLNLVNSNEHFWYYQIIQHGFLVGSVSSTYSVLSFELVVAIFFLITYSQGFSFCFFNNVITKHIILSVQPRIFMARIHQ